MTTNPTVFTLGDALVTFNPSETGPLRYVQSFAKKAGGAELNFAIGCARLGLQSKWMSRLGNDEFGKGIYKFARGEGIDVSEVEFVDGYPTSLNFKEIREDGSGKTFYYRYQSPVLTIEPEHITDELLNGVSIVHLTGVFLAIAPKNLQIVLAVLKKAKEKNIKISFDPNIRLKLWTIEDARKAYEQIFPYVDILLAGMEEVELIQHDVSKPALEAFAKQHGIGQLVIKDGANGAKLYSENMWHEKEAFKITPIDTVGAGDGFDAGYIYAALHNYSPIESLTFANAVGALVTTVKGDNEGLPELQEVLDFMNNKKAIER
ncbi:sugar kinase [Solibacillus sp. FSL K6-1554]|uniref:sugar kinase n=1 Tax=Solibacillus sp. FSL K6-1554 TaxID=2921472 RepID=UPI0030FC0F7C